MKTFAAFTTTTPASTTTLPSSTSSSLSVFPIHQYDSTVGDDSLLQSNSIFGSDDGMMMISSVIPSHHSSFLYSCSRPNSNNSSILNSSFYLSHSRNTASRRRVFSRTSSSTTSLSMLPSTFSICLQHDKTRPERTTRRMNLLSKSRIRRQDERKKSFFNNNLRMSAQKTSEGADEEGGIDNSDMNENNQKLQGSSSSTSPSTEEEGDEKEVQLDLGFDKDYDDEDETSLLLYQDDEDFEESLSLLMSVKYEDDDDDYEDESSADAMYGPFEELDDEALFNLLDLPPSDEDDFNNDDVDDYYDDLLTFEESLRMLEEDHAESSRIKSDYTATEEDVKEKESDDSMKDVDVKEEPSLLSSSFLETALLQGVVPATAGVGSGCLPGDYGFDPLNFAKRDYINTVQNFLLNLLPAPSEEKPTTTTTKTTEEQVTQTPRPTALILRDYREAEIRHGRLAMLAAIFWPLQEIIDSFVIPESSKDFTFIYGGVTLPYISLLMMGILLLLGYLDIYAKVIKEEYAGDAFLPGECFWDPLSILEGAPDQMKKKMQERELNNGRFAMMAVFFYILEETVFHAPVISLKFNQLLFEPAFEIPAVQEWLDRQFQGPSTIYPEIKSVDFVDAVEAALVDLESAAEENIMD